MSVCQKFGPKLFEKEKPWGNAFGWEFVSWKAIHTNKVGTSVGN